MSLKDAITPTGEVHKGLPVFRTGNPDIDAAQARRDAALHAALRAASRGESVTAEMQRELWESKVELFRAKGWGEPKLGRPGTEGGTP